MNRVRQKSGKLPDSKPMASAKPGAVQLRRTRSLERSVMQSIAAVCYTLTHRPVVLDYWFGCHHR